MRDPERDAREAAAKVAETKRLFRQHREANLTRKIAHLKRNRWNVQAAGLEQELAEWREAVHDLEPELTVTPTLEAIEEAGALPIPEDDDL